MEINDVTCTLYKRFGCLLLYIPHFPSSCRPSGQPFMLFSEGSFTCCLFFLKLNTFSRWGPFVNFKIWLVVILVTLCLFFIYNSTNDCTITSNTIITNNVLLHVSTFKMSSSGSSLCLAKITHTFSGVSKIKRLSTGQARPQHQQRLHIQPLRKTFYYAVQSTFY